MNLSPWVMAVRVRTLSLSMTPVAVGAALAWTMERKIHWLAVLVALIGGIFIQIGTNFANDYYDFIQGADTVERVGPRRAVAAGLVSASTMRMVMWIVFAVAFFVGLSLLKFGGWPLLVIGVASILCGIAYTGGPDRKSVV